MRKLNLTLAAAAITALAAPLAQAQTYPGSVVGNWTITGNLSPGTLSIASQAATGTCRSIAGTLYGNAVQGFYCPSTGRMHFVRKMANNATVQTWTGQLSETGPVLRMGGSFASVDSYYGGNLGEYHFSAQK